MKTVKQVSRLTGVSVRTLHHYDAIGLLPPSATTPAGYRLYDDDALERLQHILFFRALHFSLKEIVAILDAPDFDRNRALEQQIELLELQKQHIEHMLAYARGALMIGVKHMDLSTFDTRQMDNYAAQAKLMWGKTEAYREFEQKAAQRSETEEQNLNNAMMDLFRQFGTLRQGAPDAPEAQELVLRLQQFITEHFYTCTPQILAGLGQMYAGGGSMTENIDAAGGPGTAAFAARAIACFCARQ